MMARRFAVLGEPTRLRLLNQIHAHGEMSVGDLVEATGGAQANVSKHLAVMLGERMVARRRDGSRALYRIADPSLMALCDQVCEGVRDQLRELSLLVGEAEVTVR